MDPEVRQTIDDWVARKVAEGSRHAIRSSRVSPTSSRQTRLSDMRDEVARITDEWLTQHYANQETWEAPTDCERLDAAFAALEQRGIVARQHFSCCGDCARSDIAEELDASTTFMKPVGYVYYSVEETASACERGELPLSFGDVYESEEGSCDVGKLICEAMAKQRLQTEWNGTRQDRICLKGLDWKKRRPKEV